MDRIRAYAVVDIFSVNSSVIAFFGVIFSVLKFSIVSNKCGDNKFMLSLTYTEKPIY